MSVIGKLINQNTGINWGYIAVGVGIGVAFGLGLGFARLTKPELLTQI